MVFPQEIRYKCNVNNPKHTKMNAEDPNSWNFLETEFLLYWKINYPNDIELNSSAIYAIFDKWKKIVNTSHPHFTNNVSGSTILQKLHNRCVHNQCNNIADIMYSRPSFIDLIAITKSFLDYESTGTGKKKDNKPEIDPIYGATDVDPAAYAVILEPFENASRALKTVENSMSENASTSVTIPKVDGAYRPFGFYSDLLNIVKSGMFFPIYIEGETGYGKTTMVEQACAVAKKSLIRHNITAETDKTTLLVVPKLTNGTLEYVDGPVLEAMKTGSVLLLDEVDRGTEKLMCLQAILEGKPYYNERRQEMVHPAPGFNIIATGNSKGQGGNSKYSSLTILDDAFLDRFTITITHNPPNANIETEILKKFFESKNYTVKHPTFIPTLVRWAAQAREAFRDNSEEQEISTRRLLDICKTYILFESPKKAIHLCLNRFPEEIKNGFVAAWEAMQDSVTLEQNPEGTVDSWKDEDAPEI